VANILSVLSIIFIIAGIISSLYAAIILKHGDLPEYIFTFWFWLATVFFGIQSISYFISFRRSIYKYPDTINSAYLPSLRNRVAILVPIFNEDINMCIDNLLAIHTNAGNYADIYVLDDSNKVDTEPIKEICQKLNLHYIHRNNRSGYKAGALNNVLRTLNVEYVAVIDIDQTPAPDFVRETVALLDSHPEAGFVQVPQVYANTDSGVLPELAQAQQFLFYEILTEGKSVTGSLFSCGTNVIYRLNALKSVNYFDETNIVEDIATSLNLIARGWHGLYYNKKLVFGRAPTTMQGYVNQQSRWMLGSLSLVPKVFKNIIFSKKYSLVERIDWFAAATWYFFGFFYIVFLIAPFLDVLGIKVLTVNSIIYFFAWLPYTIIVMFSFFYSNVSKGAPFRYLLYNMGANMLMFSLSIQSVIYAILRKKKPFTTARTGGTMPWRWFWPQFTMMFLLGFSSVYLIIHFSLYNAITAFWAVFQFILFIPVIFINRPVKQSEMDMPVFKNAN